MARTKKLTKTQEAAIGAAREAELAAFEAFRDKYAGKRLSGTVRWFDRLSGEGIIHLNDDSGMRWPIYACNIVGKKTWFPQTACVYLNEGDVVEVEIMVNYGGSLLVCHTPGILDADKWNSLDHNNLAFRCNDAGEAITGLFASARN